MLNKAQKKQHIDKSAEMVKASKTLVFADFTGVDTASLRRLKIEVKKAGAAFKVFKKRLLNITLKELGVEFNPMQFKSQIGTFFIPEDLSSVAGTIHKFAKELAKAKKNFIVLGAYDLVGKQAVSAADFTVIAKLPGREVLLSMVIGGITGPLRAFMYIVSELAKKQPVAPSDAKALEGKPEDKAVPVAPAPEAVAPAAPAAEPAPAGQ